VDVRSAFVDICQSQWRKFLSNLFIVNDDDELVHGVNYLHRVCRSWPSYWSARCRHSVTAAAVVFCDGAKESTAGAHCLSDVTTRQTGACLPRSISIFDLSSPTILSVLSGAYMWNKSETKTETKLAHCFIDVVLLQFRCSASYVWNKWQVRPSSRRPYIHTCRGSVLP